MTKAEARAVDLVLTWIFSKPEHDWDPARFHVACLTLAHGSEKQGGRWSRERVEAQRW